MIIAIDGPAGAGKSTTARAVARRFGFGYINTGAMYRALALAACELDLKPGQNDSQIGILAQEIPLSIRDRGERICIGERDVTGEISAPQIGEMTSAISTLPDVREVIVAQQRRLARESELHCGGAVLEGRDIQTVVFPDAEVKIFLTADPRTRAARRLEQWSDSIAPKASMEEATLDIVRRDERDSSRETSPLKAADDAVHLATDGLSPDEVVDQIAAIIESRRSEARS